MIGVSVEIREGVFTRRVRITAPSIELALEIAGEGKSGRGVRLLFPIDPLRLSSSPVAPTIERLPEMKRVGIYGVDEAIPLRRETESRAWRTQLVSQGEEAPGILPGYLGPFSGGRLLTQVEASDLGRRTRTGDASDRGINRELVRQSQYNPERRLRRRFVSERCRRDTSWQRIGEARRNML